MNICTQCNQPCEIVTLHWQERDEFWGAPCWRDCYEDASECCEAEVMEIEAGEIA